MEVHATPQIFQVGNALPAAVKSTKQLSYRKCRFQDSVDEIEDALQHDECMFYGFSAPIHEEDEQGVPTLAEEAPVRTSRKRAFEETEEKEEEEEDYVEADNALKEDVASYADVEEDVAAYADIYSEDDVYFEAHTGACCRLLDLVLDGPRPGLASQFVCQHGEFAPGSTCDSCVEEAEQRAIAAFSGRFDFGHEVNGQMAVVWVNSASSSKCIDLITTADHERVRTMIDLYYSGDRYSLRNIAFNTSAFWNAVFLFLETGSSGHVKLDETLDKSFTAARDEDV